MKNLNHIYFVFLLLFLLTGCNEAIAQQPLEIAMPLPTSIDTPTATYTPPATATSTHTATYTPSPSATHTQTATQTPMPSVTATNTPTIIPPTSTPTSTSTSTPVFVSLVVPETPTITPSPAPITDPSLTIQALSEREYGGGELEIVETLADRKGYTRYLYTYPSDGLTIYGYMDVPKHATDPYPVAVVVHGHLPPHLYNTQTYTRRYTAPLAESGYIVLHPNMRGFYPSDDGMDWFRVGVATDVLNLLGILKATTGQPGPLEQADPSFIGLMGHSMGGGVALRVATVDQDISATVLYSSMSGNERWNYEKILRWSGGKYGHRELVTPDSFLAQVSPNFHLHRITGPVAIHNGEADGGTIKWGIDLCDQLKGIEKPTDCFTYPGQPHIFEGAGDKLFTKRLIEFFDKVRLGTETSTKIE
ncbi:alpha/beta fold hydrolase [Anaerolineales bacterium HSG24]|nr:alpha/beta fold hydrolase [Anaerolineales bacterium HSG24]